MVMIQWYLAHAVGLALHTKQTVYTSALVLLLHLMPSLKHVMLLLSQMQQGRKASRDFHGKMAHATKTELSHVLYIANRSWNRGGRPVFNRRRAEMFYIYLSSRRVTSFVRASSDRPLSAWVFC